jgi:hypothetical protein
MNASMDKQFFKQASAFLRLANFPAQARTLTLHYEK